MRQTSIRDARCERCGLEKIGQSDLSVPICRHCANLSLTSDGDKQTLTSRRLTAQWTRAERGLATVVIITSVTALLLIVPDSPRPFYTFGITLLAFAILIYEFRRIRS